MDINGVIVKIGAIESTVGGFFISQLGGWDKELYALVSLTVVDFILDLIIGFLGKSDNMYSSKLFGLAGVKGLVRKAAAFLCVFVACILDIIIGSDFIREGVIIAFCATELISIMDYLTCLGIPVTPIIEKAINILINHGNGRNKK